MKNKNNIKKNKYSNEKIELWMKQASEITRKENEREKNEYKKKT